VDEIQNKIAALYEKYSTVKKRRSSKLDSNSKSIWCYTVNIGPESPHWNYPIRGSWYFQDITEYLSREDEVSSFVHDLAVPYITSNIEPLFLRDTLLEKPGQSQNLFPYEEILAIDMLYEDRERTIQDISVLRDRFSKYEDQPKHRFEYFVSLVEKELLV
jgi:hypothetical protein